MSRFLDLGVGLGRLRDIINKCEKMLQYIASEDGQGLDLRDVMSEEAKEVLVALSWIVDTAVSNLHTGDLHLPKRRMRNWGGRVTRGNNSCRQRTTLYQMQI